MPEVHWPRSEVKIIFEQLSSLLRFRVTEAPDKFDVNRIAGSGVASDDERSHQQHACSSCEFNQQLSVLYQRAVASVRRYERKDVEAERPRRCEL